MNEVNKRQFVAGSIWKVVEQFSTRGLSMVVSIILARILSPNDYGLIALTTIFTNFSSILIDGGFSTALIRKKYVDEYDYSSTLLISFTISTLLYAVIFLFAPWISTYYGEPELAGVLRVIGLVLFIQAFGSIRTAYVNRNLQFKLLFMCNFFGTLISGIIGVIAAYAGLGVWALVAQQLLQQLILTLLLLVRLKWRLSIKFDISRIKEMLKFSFGVVLASLINFISSSLYSLIIGKKYTVEDLGYFDKGGQLPTQMSLYTFGAMSNVLLPTLASHQSDIVRVKQIVRKVVRMTSYLISPMMFGLALITEEVVVLLFTEKWLPITRIMQWNCLYYLATPFMLINIQVFFALGYSSKRVKTELLRLLMLVSGILIFGIWLECTIDQLALVCAVIAVLSAIVTYIELMPMINYSIRECISDLLMPLAVSVVMAIAISVSGRFVLDTLGISSMFLRLIIKVIVGVCVYVALSAFFQIDGYNEIKQIIVQFLHKTEESNA